MKLRIPSIKPLAVLLCLILLAACHSAETDFSDASSVGKITDESVIFPAVSITFDPNQAQSMVQPSASEDAPDRSAVQDSPSSVTPEPDTEPDTEPEPEPEPSRNSTLYVLMYHHFIREGVPPTDWVLTETRLREDLRWLADHGYTTVLPRELAAGEPLPERAVMLTFDDGYASNYELAFPILQEYNAKAVINLIAGHIVDGKSGFLSWDQCREMDQSGLVEFGSHTNILHNSEYGGISRAPGETQAEYEARVFPDLRAGIDLIEENIGTKVHLFAYPLGKTDDWATDFIREHFDATVTSKTGKTDISKGLYNMNRYNISASNSPGSFLPG